MFLKFYKKCTKLGRNNYLIKTIKPYVILEWKIYNSLDLIQIKRQSWCNMTSEEKCLPIMMNEMLEVTRKNENQNILLEEEICHQYKPLIYKGKIIQLFKRLKQKRYLRPEENIKLTSSYEANASRTTTSNFKSTTERAVDTYIDMLSKENEVCNKLLVLADKLTLEEGIYFVYAFFYKETEDDISNILNISRTSLQKIKKSCLIKAWFELNIFCEND